MSSAQMAAILSRGDELTWFSFDPIKDKQSYAQ